MRRTPAARVPPRAMKIPCPAKINLYLDVLGRRSDGYHDIVTVMQAIDLRDEVSIGIRGGGGIAMTCDAAGLPVDSRNLCVRAALGMARYAPQGRGVVIRLAKRIPVAAGLGGGSSDAAGVLLGLNRLWGAGLAPGALEEIAAGLGSDVPYFIPGGTARCGGRGEAVSPVRGGPDLAYVLLVPPVAVPTAGVYASLEGGGPGRAPGVAGLLEALARGDPRSVAARLYNRLEDAPGAHRGEVDRLKALLVSRGALGACMSGSGPAVFGLARTWPAPGASPPRSRGRWGRGRSCISD